MSGTSRKGATSKARNRKKGRTRKLHEAVEREAIPKQQKEPTGGSNRHSEDRTSAIDGWEQEVESKKKRARLNPLSLTKLYRYMRSIQGSN